jgi:hypothetical protein
MEKPLEAQVLQIRLVERDTQVCQSAFCHYDKCLGRSTSTRRGLLWLTASQVSAHGCLALLLWACGSAVHHGDSSWPRRSLHRYDVDIKHLLKRLMCWRLNPQLVILFWKVLETLGGRSMSPRGWPWRLYLVLTTMSCSASCHKVRSLCHMFLPPPCFASPWTQN